METEQRPRVELQGVFDRTLVEEAALAVEGMETGDLMPVIDCSRVSAVLMDGVLMLRSRATLRRCSWENSPAMLRRYARTLAIEMDFADSTGTSRPGSPGVVVACTVCGESMRLPQARRGNYACPHCANRFYADPGESVPSRPQADA